MMNGIIRTPDDPACDDKATGAGAEPMLRSGFPRAPGAPVSRREQPAMSEQAAIVDHPSRLEQTCLDKGIKMTDQRRIICRVLSEADDHPDVEQVYRRAQDLDPNISIATVYRTMRLLEEAAVVTKLDLGDGRARYEDRFETHHHHLVDVQSGSLIEFSSDELERLKDLIAREMGFELIGHRLELYGIPLPRESQSNNDPASA
jgi:Fur family ferric uptake transcriptional regulator